MQRLIYGALSLFVLIAFLAFALPVFLIIIGFVLVFVLFGLLTGRGSFRVYRSAPPPQAPPSQSSPPLQGKIIDITQDQDKK